MNETEVLSYLQSQFAGQLVLYVDDLAKVLGKSPKAIAELISRNKLPFKIKMVGGLRCVDIFQIATWMSNVPGAAREAAQQALVAPSNGRPSKSRRSASAAPPEGLHPEVPKEKPTPMFASLLQMRHDYVGRMSQFVFELHDPDEVLFMNEVAEKLFFSENLLQSSFAVTVRKLAPPNFKLRAEVTTKHFETEALACAFFMPKIARAQSSKNKHSIHFVMSHSGETVFHAIACGPNFTVVNNAIGLEFLGF